jgi:hypothetical protein
VAKEDIVKYQFDKRTAEEQHEIAVAGGKASGEVRREKATMKKQLEAMLNSTNNKGKQYKDLVSLGLIANAIDKTKGGNPKAYEIIAKMLGELEVQEQNETPQVNINIVDNSNLEGAMYEDNN